MLEEDVQSPDHVEDLRFIQRQLQYGKEIVEGLLHFSRPSWETKRKEALNPILQGVLAICWRIIEEAAGSITASSEVGQGTTFCIRLPLVGMVPHPTPRERPQVMAQRTGRPAAAETDRRQESYGITDAQDFDRG